ncbi:type II toxin-antitoxin system VapC family toxin [Acetobacter sp. TBRC 12305]|uniref:Type II toxin-antitoxin system VapC family toxin n=1 Tax=Acetobacter garciniae TaxID=2817435 RepID=A0A939KNY3_9PROT|nr:type II toxin-antitoxin system VapC family toxin [Acetobacter garciniae]MBO1326185.1 type II toxin-antitoxin system VapC family toxin [Acetobacter garciniae]MBX0346078.1 type II toxin-antitoxin system VapC family toxin [Acetobacter garciniae]
MFDTKTVSDIVRGDETILRHVERLDPRQCCVSAVTAGEVAYGLARRPDATRLHRLTHAVMSRLEVLPWDQDTAQRYGKLRVSQERHGLSLGALDMMIAAHALACKLTLVTSDQAFAAVKGLSVRNFRSG